MISHDSTKTIFFQNIKIKAEFKNLDDSQVLSSDFPDLRTSAASTTSMASITFTVSFRQKKITDPDSWIIPGTKVTNSGPFLRNGSSKIQFFTDFSTNSVGGC
jgi:hypothetical protein